MKLITKKKEGVNLQCVENRRRENASLYYIRYIPNKASIKQFNEFTNK